MNTIGRIPRSPLPARAAFAREFERADRPVIFEAAIEHWPARVLWTRSGLAERIGDVETRYKASPSHRHPDFRAGDPAQIFATGKATFRELLALTQGDASARRLLTGDEEFLIRRRPDRPDELNPKLRRLLADFAPPPLFDPARLYTVWFWLSGAGVRTWLHYDNNGCHNLNAQVQGEKRVWLFPPDQLGRTYPFLMGGALPAYNCCQVDIEEPDLERFPEFARAECIEGELREGDLLFIPAHWLHSFLHVGAFNVNVNFWWKPLELRESPVSIRQAFLDMVASGDICEDDATLARLDRDLTRGGV